MSDALVPSTVSRAITAGTPIVMPRLIIDAGPAATERFLEFFAAQIANERTREA